MTAALKPYKTYDEQLEILTQRGMDVGDRSAAKEQLKRVNYYRLSGYWYSFREIQGARRVDRFYEGTTLADVLQLYAFDERLRTATFNALAPIELAIRAELGHTLGQLDPAAHLNPAMLNAQAKRGTMYTTWLSKYTDQVSRSQEDFVVHHKSNYSAALPTWVAVEVLDWGSLRYLYDMTPRPAQDQVASGFGLSAPQLSSWLKALEIVRNSCAHHGRLFNKVFAKAPRMPAPGTHEGLDRVSAAMTRAFGQLTMIQYMRAQSGLAPSSMLSAVLSSYPSVAAVPITHLGMTDDWRLSSLWP